MRLCFVDADPAVVEAIREAFCNVPEVSVALGDLLAAAENTVVSPANSQGFMDGGIDLAYLSYFGPTIQSQVLEAINRRPEEFLPIGASVVVHTGHRRIPYLILAPTMTGPEFITADNSYRAMRAVLRIAGDDSVVGRSVYCPGLGTGVGSVDPRIAAEQMAEAYRDWQASKTRD
jgi:O-acetyl-ADP-ribose deacetylase (regulator of RNase III)